MQIATLSLKARQMLIFFGVVVVILPLVFVSIEQAFRQSQTQALEQQLQANLYTIIGEIDLDTEIPSLSTGFLPPQLNQVDSGTFALIELNQIVVWRSDSGINLEPVMPAQSLAPGEQKFEFSEGFWRFSYGLFYDNDFGTHQVVIHVLQQPSILQTRVDAFNQIILAWFTAIGAVLILALSIGLYSTLWPIKKLDQQIKQVEKGNQNHISGDFPSELVRIKEDLNLLINAQERQKERYRAYLSDLTHALKTPVAVMRSNPQCQGAQITEQLDRMTSIIEHQLRKASSGGDVIWKKKVTFNPVVNKLIGVMSKIYAAKDIQFTQHFNDEYNFYGDEDDLMEILGNLIDNACKACQSQVKLSVYCAEPLCFVIEDDGPGVPADKREQLLVRGQRLDSYEQGHGVGMAIVNDLINSYHGHIEIDDSTMGGAKFIVHFTKW